ncbi:MAG TPA: hypothetical protein VGX00_05005 [Thermoplasmata archaeon]|nr:hypothetical protein [Thermoplasmata archaeon]
MPSTQPPGLGRLARLRRFLRAHPIVFLALLTPGIPEYLSGSSPFSNVLYNPFWLVLGLGFNLGMYLPGVLLVREAQIRWNKGWATVVTLGAAYAIVEEGLGLSTMFNPQSTAAGAAGAYGHALGVNWVWVPEVMLVHMVYSIGLPILLFWFAIPDLRGKSLLNRRGIITAFAIFAIDIVLLAATVGRINGFWMGDPVLLGSLLSVGALVGLAYLWPRDLLRPAPGAPRRGVLAFGLVGAIFFVGLLLVPSVLESWHVPAGIVAASVPVYAGAILWWVLRNLGDQGSERRLLALSVGLLLPIVAIGIVTQFRLPIVLLADLFVYLFFRELFAAQAERRPPFAAGRSTAAV